MNIVNIHEHYFKAVKNPFYSPDKSLNAFLKELKEIMRNR